MEGFLRQYSTLWRSTLVKKAAEGLPHDDYDQTHSVVNCLGATDPAAAHNEFHELRKRDLSCALDARTSDFGRDKVASFSSNAARYP
jgi:hypothetical protein